MNYSLSYPAVNGETVTQGHADYCATHGHAVHTVAGEVQGTCPRCGEVRTADVPKVFAELASLEESVRSARVSAGMALSFFDRSRNYDTWQASKARLFASLDTLTPEQMKAYGEWRKAQQG